ncbi:MAG: long-chain fatty acid--CoA ligase [Rhodothermales bacterium]|nr:long-chain fatty acid--CoA ligase [Rhodothermales bacterium]
MGTLIRFETVPEMFEGLADRFAGTGELALRYKDRETKEWVDIDWDEFRRRVYSMAGFLYARGVRPGDRVAILSENRPEWAVTDMATQLLGGVNVSLYTSLPPREVSYIIHDSGASVFIVSTRIQLKKALEIYDLCPDLRLVLSMTELDEEMPDYVRDYYRSVDEGHSLYEEFSDAIHAHRKSVQPDDIAALIYTSGTTGKPKGVMLTHENFCSNVQSAILRLPFGPDDVHLSFLPLCHSFERTGGYLGALSTGVKIAYAESIDTVTRDITEIRPTILLSVPRLYEKIFNAVAKSVDEGSDAQKKVFAWAQRVGWKYHLKKANGQFVGPVLSASKRLAHKLVFSKLHEKLGGRLKYGVSGGAALPASIGKFFFSAGIPIVEGYGLTETAPVLTVSPFDKPRYGAVGHVIDGVTVGIQDLNSGDMLGQISGEDYPTSLTTEAGEIVARGPNIMKGYWGDPEATRAAIDPDGWYHTGDVGRFDDGALVITDRIKHMIVSAGGKNIYPGPIEEGFKHEPWIDQIMVVGEGREFLTALVVPEADAIARYAKENSIAGSSLEEWLESEEVRKVFSQVFRSYSRDAASHEKVRKFSFVPEPFTVENGMMTPTMKLRRNIISERFADQIDALYEGVI